MSVNSKPKSNQGLRVYSVGQSLLGASLFCVGLGLSSASGATSFTQFLSERLTSKAPAAKPPSPAKPKAVATAPKKTAPSPAPSVSATHALESLGDGTEAYLVASPAEPGVLPLTASSLVPPAPQALHESQTAHVRVYPSDGLPDKKTAQDNTLIPHVPGPMIFVAQGSENSTVTESRIAPVPSVAPTEPASSPSANQQARAPANAAPPNLMLAQAPSSKGMPPKGVSFADWAKEQGVRNPSEQVDPTRENAGSWTKMEVSPDLPPRVAVLGEDLIGAVAKELPSERARRLAMPYDEFKLRVRDAVLAFPDVGVAQSQLGIAQAGTSESRAPLLPQINGFSESGKRSVGQDSYLGTPAYSRDGSNYGVSVRQVLFDFGAAIFGFQSGKAKERAAQELLNSKRSEQALKTVASVIDLERARAQMNLANDNASSRLAIVKLVRERFDLGGGSKPDIIRAEARFAESLATVTNAQNRLKAAEAGYREAFAANPIGIIRGPNFEVTVDKLDATAEQMASSYPGLLQLAQLRDSADAEAKAALARTLPSLNFAYDNIINGVSAPLAPSRTTNALLQLKYNFYTGGAESARKDQATLKAKQAEQEFQSGLRQYERVLTQNQADVRNSDALVAARRVAAGSAISSMRAVREQFAFNKGTLLDLLTVQESLFNAGRDLVDAEADRQISRYRYLHLTSGLDQLFDLSERTYEARSEVRR